MPDWPGDLTRIPAGSPAAYAAELRRHLEDPEAVIVLNGDGSIHGVRRLTLGEMWAEADGIMDVSAPHTPGGQP